MIRASSRLRLALVTDTFAPEVNGVAMTLGRLVDGMRSRGHDVTVVRPRRPEDPAPERPWDATIDENEIVLPSLPLPKYPEVRLAWPWASSWRRVLARRAPDRVHVATETALGHIALGWARDRGIPVTTSWHTRFDAYVGRYGAAGLTQFALAWLTRFHRRARSTLVPTASLARGLAAYHLPGLAVLGRGVDTALFDPRKRSPDERAAWGMGATDVVALGVGRLAPEKDWDDAAEAVARARAQGVPATLVLVGDGPDRARLAGLPHVHLTGVRRGEDLARAYASADLFLFPSRTETFGNVLQEAMASGLPAVAVGRGAAREVLVDGVHGWRVDTEEREPWRQAAVAALHVAPDQRVHRGRAARAAMLDRSWDAIVDTFEAHLHEIGGS